MDPQGQPSDPLSETPPGRYNDWGKRRLIIASEDWQNHVSEELRHLDVTPRCRSLLWAARLTQSQGLEFVFLSNSEFGSLTLPHTGITLVPCFTPLDPRRPSTERRQAAMMRRGTFVYDGWFPLHDVSAVSVEDAINQLDEFALLFSLSGPFVAHWEPKYHYYTTPIPSQITLPSEFSALLRSISVAQGLPLSDRLALRRSLAWFANAFRNYPIQRFLMLFLSIESLATYIESDTSRRKSHLARNFSSPLPPKRERARLRRQCIQTTLETDRPLTDKVRDAYFGCVQKSIKEMLTAHLNAVFSDESATKLLFGDELNGKSLWSLRNTIAHGSLNLLNHEDATFITLTLPQLEGTARAYFRRILQALAREEYFPALKRPILSLSLEQAVSTPGASIQPEDMAEFYASPWSLEGPHINVSFSQ